MLKNLSRKGAKTQREIQDSEARLASLRLCVRFFFALLICLVACSLTFAQKRVERFDPDGSFWVLADLPNEFSEFSEINLNAKRSRRLSVQGFVVGSGKRLAFKTLTVKRDNFTFTTVAAGGVSYAFAGKFLKGGVYYASDLDDTIPVLEGTLTKFRNGEKVAEAKLKFSYFAGT